MTRLTHGLAVLALAALLVPADALAQRGPRGERGPAFHGDGDGPGLEMIMRMRERLELTEDQIAQLDAIRQETVARRTAHRAEMDELRSQVRAGQLEREALREAMEARRETAEAMRDATRERVDAILTEAQREELDTLRREGRAFMRGRAGVRRGGRGFDGPRFQRGMRGPRMDFRGRRPFRRGGGPG